MAKLKLGVIADDRPVKLTIELPATVHRDLVAYGQVLARETGQGAIEPAKLIAPMLVRFMVTDGAFAKLRLVLGCPLGQLLRTGLPRLEEGHEAPDDRVLKLTGSHANDISTEAPGSSMRLNTTPANPVSA